MRLDILWPLALVFISVSLSSVGGGSSTLATVQHQAVDVHQWVSAREFIELFAISRAAPGPGSMLATLLGWKAAGWLGALVATVCMYVPAAILCLFATQLWNRYRDRAWHAALRQGLAPIGTGLTLAAVVAVSRVSGAGILSWGVTGASALILIVRPNLHPFVLLAGGALVFVAVWAISG